MTSGDDFAPVDFIQHGGSYRMAYRHWGRADGPETVVLLHGITSSSLTWIRVGPALARRFRVLAVDFKGHGDSDKPPDGYRLAEQAAEVAELCQRLAISNPIVIGHSWGGAIALVLATSTNFISKLILEDPAVGRRTVANWHLASRDSYSATVGLTREAATELAAPNLARGWTQADVAGKIDAAMKGSPEAVRAVFDTNGSWDLSEALSRIPCPTLLLRAEPELGGIVDEEVARLAAQNPLVRVETIAGADHNIHRGRYEAFMSAVTAFLEGTDEGPADRPLTLNAFPELLRRAAEEMLGTQRMQDGDLQRALEITSSAVVRVLREPRDGDPRG